VDRQPIEARSRTRTNARRRPIALTSSALEVVRFASNHEHHSAVFELPPPGQHGSAHRSSIFATPIYWYGVSPAMKVFLDRISDFLELPELLAEGRRLRGKNAYVVCTSTVGTDMFRRSTICTPLPSRHACARRYRAILTAAAEASSRARRSADLRAVP
jgi:putative NADPH-quinone reductase